MNRNLEELKMLKKAMEEIALYCDDGLDTPISLSLYLQIFDIMDPAVKDELIKKSKELISTADDPRKLTVKDFQHEFHKIASQISIEPDEAAPTVYIVNWIGMYAVPEAYPLGVRFKRELEALDM
ncbi:MAG: hypothetical protein SOH62_02940 [Lactobacillus sp.]|jgi:hypothetical protein